MLRISRFWHGGSPTPRIELHGEHIVHQSPRHFTKMNNADHRAVLFRKSQRYCTIAQPNFTYVDSIKCAESWENSLKPNENLVFEKPPKHNPVMPDTLSGTSRELPHEDYINDRHNFHTGGPGQRASLRPQPPMWKLCRSFERSTRPIHRVSGSPAAAGAPPVPWSPRPATGRRIALAGRYTVRDLAVEFGPAEVVDSLLLRRRSCPTDPCSPAIS
jgi:hypothetical protein